MEELGNWNITCDCIAVFELLLFITSTESIFNVCSKTFLGKSKNAVVDLLTTRTKEQRQEIGEAYKKKENEVRLIRGRGHNAMK